MSNPYGSRYERDERERERRGLRESRDQPYGGEHRFRREQHDDERYAGESAKRQSYARDEEHSFGAGERAGGLRGYSPSRRFGNESYSGSQSDWGAYPAQSRSFERSGYDGERELFWDAQGSAARHGQRYGAEPRSGAYPREGYGQRASGAAGAHREGGGHAFDPDRQYAQQGGSSNYWEHGGGGRSYQPGYGAAGSADASGNYWEHGGRFGVGASPSAGFRGRAPKGYTRSDERIREDICERLMSTPWIDPGEVSVEVKDGNVSLDGSVPERSMKHPIEDIAEGCSGVKNVDNRIRVARHVSSGGGFEAGAGMQAGSSGASGRQGASADAGGAQHAHSAAQAARSK